MSDYVITVGADFQAVFQGLSRVRGELQALAAQGDTAAAKTAAALQGPAATQAAVGAKVAQTGVITTAEQQAFAKSTALGTAVRVKTGDLNATEATAKIKEATSGLAASLVRGLSETEKEFQDRIKAVQASLFSTAETAYKGYITDLGRKTSTGGERDVGTYASRRSAEIDRDADVSTSEKAAAKKVTDSYEAQATQVKAVTDAYAQLNKALRIGALSQEEYDAALIKLTGQARTLGIALERSIASAGQLVPKPFAGAVGRGVSEYQAGLARAYAGLDSELVIAGIAVRGAAAAITQGSTATGAALAQSSAQMTALGPAVNEVVSGFLALAPVIQEQAALQKAAFESTLAALTAIDVALQERLAIETAAVERAVAMTTAMDQALNQRLAKELEQVQKANQLTTAMDLELASRSAIELQQVQRGNAITTQMDLELASRIRYLAALEGMTSSVYAAAAAAQANRLIIENDTALYAAIGRTYADAMRGAAEAFRLLQASVLADVERSKILADIRSQPLALPPGSKALPAAPVPASEAVINAKSSIVPTIQGADSGVLTGFQNAVARFDLSTQELGALFNLVNASPNLDPERPARIASPIGPSEPKFTGDTSFKTEEDLRVGAAELGAKYREMAGAYNAAIPGIAENTREAYETDNIVDLYQLALERRIASLNKAPLTELQIANAGAGGTGGPNSTPSSRAYAYAANAQTTYSLDDASGRGAATGEGTRSDFRSAQEEALKYWREINQDLAALAELVGAAKAAQSRFNTAADTAATRFTTADPGAVSGLVENKVAKNELNAQVGSRVAATEAERIALQQSALADENLNKAARSQLLRATTNAFVTQEQIDAVLKQQLGVEGTILALKETERVAKAEAASIYQLQREAVARSLATQTALTAEEAKQAFLANAEGVIDREKIALLEAELTAEAQTLAYKKIVNIYTKELADNVFLDATASETSAALGAERIRILTAANAAAAKAAGGVPPVPPTGGAGAASGAASGAGAGSGAGKYKPDFKRGLTSSIQYGLPSLVLFGGARALVNAAKDANQLQIEYAIIESQLDSIGQSQAFDKLADSALASARATGQNTVEVVNLQSQLIGAFSSLNAEDNPNLTGDIGKVVSEQSDAAVKLAEVAGLPLTEITDGLTAASIAYDTGAEEIGNIVVNLSNRTGVLAKELVGFIGDIAPTAKEAGFELEGILTLAAQVQQRSGRSGTTLAEQFNRILPAVSQNKQALFELGAAYDDLGTPEFFQALESGNVADLFKEIGNSFPALNKEIQDELFQSLGSRREAGSLIPVFENYDQFEELVNAAGDSEGELDKRFQSVAKTLGNTIARVREGLKQLFIELYDSGISDVFANMAKGLEAVVKLLTPLLDGIAKVNDLTGGYLANFIAIGLAIKGAVALYGKLAASAVIANTATRAQTVGAQYQLLRQPQAAALISALSVLPGKGGAGVQTIPQPQRLQATKPAAAVGAARVGLGGSFAGLGATAGITAGIAAYSFLSGKANSWEQEIKDLGEERKNSDQSFQSLYDEANKLESSGAGGPGFWEKVGAFVTGKDLVTEADALRTAAITKQKSEVLDIIESNTGSDAYQDFVETYINAILANISETGPGTVGSTLGNAKEIQALIDTEGIDAAREKAKELDNALVPQGAPNQFQDYVDEVEQVADLLGLNGDELTTKVLDIITAKGNTAKNIQEEIKRLQEDNSDPETLATLIRLSSSLEKTGIQRDPDLGDELNGRIANLRRESGELAKDLELAAVQYELGIISFGEYYEILAQNAKDLALAADQVSDPEAQIAELKAAAKVLEEVSNRRKLSVDSFLKNIDQSGRGDTVAGTQAQLDRLKSQLANADQLTTEDTQALIDSYYDIAVSNRSARADLADTEEEADRIRQESIDIDPAVLGAKLRATLDEVTVDAKIFIDKWNKATANSGIAPLAGNFFDVLIEGVSNGSIDLKQVEDIIRQKLEELKGVIQKQIQTLFKTASLLLFFNKEMRDALIAQIKSNFALYEQGQLLLDSGVFDETDIAPETPDASDAKKNNKYDAARGFIALQKARANGNDIVDLLYDQRSAEEDLVEALAGDDQGAKYEAFGKIIDIQNEIADAQRERASAVRAAAAKIADSIGNSVESANIELQLAFEEYQYQLERFGAGTPEAEDSRAELVDAMIAARDALQKRTELFVEVIAAQRKLDENPVVMAEAEIKLATQQLQKAVGVDEQLAAQKRLLDANKQYQQAIQEVRISQFQLRQAELDAAEDEIGSAQIAVAIAQQQLADAQGRGAGQAEINGLRAQLISAQKNATETRFSERRDDYDFLYDMEEITKSQYIDLLRAEQALRKPGTDAWRELARTIKGLEDDLSGDLQNNLPSTIDTPTLYEVRRLLGTGTSGSSSPGQAGGVGYQDNRNMDVKIYVNNGMTQQQVVGAFSDAVGLGRNGQTAGLY